MSRGRFTGEVRRLAAERAGYLCSRPNCPNPYTIGPLGDDRRTCLGDAAHIHAAADTGPRAAPEMSDDDLRSVENAIWLCARCHRLVDGDEARFSVEELRHWKEAAEARAQARLDGYGPEPAVRVPDLLSPRAGFWRAGLVAQLATGNLGVAHVEHAVRDAVASSIQVLIPSFQGRVPVLLDEDGLLVEHVSEDGHGLRVRGTQMGQFEVSLAFPFTAAPPGDSSALPVAPERGIGLDQVLLAVSVVVRFYCGYGARLAGTGNRLLNWQIFRDHIAKKLGRVRVDAVEQRHVEELKDAVAKRIGAVVANRTLTVLSALMGWAERRGEIPRGANPCTGVARFREQGRERFLRPEERAALEAVITEAEQRPAGAAGSVTAGAALCIRLLALTGARLSEITGLRWGMVDLQRACLRLPDSKTGAKVVPLAPQAVALLHSVRPANASRDALVCPSGKGTELRNMGRVWIRLCASAGLEGVRAHDLRHSFASDALNAGVPLAHVGAALGHKDQRTTARYAHVADEALRRSLEAAGNAIETSILTGANVARLPIPSEPRKPAQKRRRPMRGG